VSDINVELADNPRIFVPAIETPEYIEAAAKAMRLQNAPFMTTILEGAYPHEYLEQQGNDAPVFSEDEMKTISERLDFVGVNAYYPMYVRPANNEFGYELIDAPADYPTMGADWIKFGPQIIYWAARHLKEIWGIESIYISENGCAATDIVNEKREILDVDRVAYLREHLESTLRALSEDYPVKGYFVWSYIDNFEWADGYNYRFGIVYVDYETLERIPKLSADFYREVIRSNTLV
jgi:beta-glucosidase